MDQVERVLTPANENPWYVLMTLYGEQDGVGVDETLHAQNRAAWNAWSCQAMTAKEQEDAAELSQVVVEELRSWGRLQAEVVRLHEAEMMRRNVDGFVYPGLPDVNDEVDLTQVRFVHQLTMNKSVFSKRVGFGGATFDGAALFESAIFCGAAWFGHATFGGAALFDAATFNGSAAFVFTIFSGHALFEGATFIGTLRFVFAEFGGEAGFSFATFRDEVQFDWAMFSRFAYFADAKFGAMGEHHSVSFKDCQFLKPTNFRDAIFHSQYPDFAGAVLHDKTTFTAKADNWPKGKQADPEQAKASCAAIRHNLGRQGLPEDEHFFFRREMEFATQIGGFWQRLPYWLFGCFSEYGHSIALPSAWLGGCWALGFALFWGYFLTVSGYDRPMGTAFAFSFSNMFQVFGFGRLYFGANFMATLPRVLQVYAGVQTVAALPLLFFLGLGLRSRFRLR